MTGLVDIYGKMGVNSFVAEAEDPRTTSAIYNTIVVRASQKVYKHDNGGGMVLDRGSDWIGPKTNERCFLKLSGVDDHSGEGEIA